MFGGRSLAFSSVAAEQATSRMENVPTSNNAVCHVVEIANATAGNDRDRHCIGNGASERDIESVTGAVSVH